MKNESWRVLPSVIVVLAVSGCAWELTGNAGTDPNTNFLGTTDNQPLVIKTNNNDVMNIGTNGNVGIGTAVTGEKLSVAGRIESSSGGFRFPDGTVQATAATAGTLTVTTRTATATLGPQTCCTGATAICNAGEVVTGGGFERADDPALEVRFSRPAANGWTAQMTNYGTATRNLTVYAVCMRLQ